MLHDVIQTQGAVDISESKNECWTAAKLSKDPSLLFSFSSYFLNSTILQNSVITKNISFIFCPDFKSEWELTQ